MIDVRTTPTDCDFRPAAAVLVIQIKRLVEVVDLDGRALLTLESSTPPGGDWTWSDRYPYLRHRAGSPFQNVPRLRTAAASEALTRRLGFRRSVMTEPRRSCAC